MSSQNAPIAPSGACLTFDAFYTQSEDEACNQQWRSWDRYCGGLSEADKDRICDPVELELVKALKPDIMPNDDVDCMTPEAFEWSDDYCGGLWKEYDDWCYFVDWWKLKDQFTECVTVNAEFWEMFPNHGQEDDELE